MRRRNHVEHPAANRVDAGATRQPASPISDLREAAVTFLAIAVALALVVLALFAVGACTLHVDVTVRPQMVAPAIPQDAPEQHPALYGLPMGDGGTPCGLSITSITGGSDDPCGAATHYIDAGANVIYLQQSNCQRFGSNAEYCW